jgi:hypothetical protein
VKLWFAISAALFLISYVVARFAARPRLPMDLQSDTFVYSMLATTIGAGSMLLNLLAWLFIWAL